MKSAMSLSGVLVMLSALNASAAPTYTQTFGLDEEIGMNPYSVSSAYIRQETFPPSIHYWQPAVPNVWSEVVYKFDVPFTIQTARVHVSVSAYTIGNPDANFDDGAESYVDVSHDGVTYTNIGAAYPGNAIGYDSVANNEDDITLIVAGSDTIYVRARQFMTVDYASFNASQFLRSGPGGTFFVSAVGVPEPQSVVLLGVGIMGLLLSRRGGRCDSLES